MFFKLALLVCSLAAFSIGHETGTSKINVSQICKDAMYKALHPNSTECNFGKTADLSLACPKLDSCLETQRNIIKNECTKDENENSDVKQVIEFQVAIDMKSRCLKDTAGNWCKRLNSTSDAKVCKECDSKMDDMINMVTATANEQTKQKFMKDKSDMCKPKDNSTSTSTGDSRSESDKKGGSSGGKEIVASSASSATIGALSLISVYFATLLHDL
jgi:hypothetical protein